MPGTDGPDVFTGREAALAWLDAERGSLVAAVAMAADIGRDHVALHLPIRLAEYFLWRRQFDDWIPPPRLSAWTPPGASASGMPRAWP